MSGIAAEATGAVVASVVGAARGAMSAPGTAAVAGEERSAGSKAADGSAADADPPAGARAPAAVAAQVAAVATTRAVAATSAFAGALPLSFPAVAQVIPPGDAAATTTEGFVANGLLSSYWRVRPNQVIGSPGDGEPGGRPGAAAAAAASRDEADSAEAADPTLLPQGIDRLAENLPVDLARLDRALQHYLDQVDEVGGALADLLTADGLRPWLLGAALAMAASVVARHRARQSQTGPALAGADGLVAPWFPNLVPEES